MLLKIIFSTVKGQTFSPAFSGSSLRTSMSNVNKQITTCSINRCTHMEYTLDYYPPSSPHVYGLIPPVVQWYIGTSFGLVKTVCHAVAIIKLTGRSTGTISATASVSAFSDLSKPLPAWKMLTQLYLSV